MKCADLSAFYCVKHCGTRVLDRILRDGVAQQVEPHDGHGEADHGNHDGS